MAVTNKLRDSDAKAAKPAAKPYKISDGEGMHLLVSVNGTRQWQYSYRWLGKQRTISFGVYPEVTLQRARELRLEARRLLASGVDPSADRQQKKQAERDQANNTFESVALDWLALHIDEWKPPTVANHTRYLNLHILPKLGKLPIDQIEGKDVLAALKPLEKNGLLETAKRCRQTCGNVFRHGVALGRCKYDPTATIESAMKAPQTTHFKSVQASDMPQLLSDIDGFDGITEQTRLLMKLYILSVCRPTATASIEWSFFDWDAATITIPAAKMKGRKSEEQIRPPHVIPISRQAMVLWRELFELTGHKRFCFASYSKSGHYQGEVIVKALHRMGWDETAHGMRSTASTAFYESGLWREDAIEAQLSHKPLNKTKAAYNRASYLPERTLMMQWWADQIDVWRGIK